MKKIIISFLFSISISFLFAQQKQLTIEDAMINARTTLAPENLKQLQFIKGTNDYVYLKKINGVDNWMRGNFATKEDAIFLSLSAFNEYLKKASIDTVTSMPAVQFSAKDFTATIKGQKISFQSDYTS